MNVYLEKTQVVAIRRILVHLFKHFLDERWFSQCIELCGSAQGHGKLELISSRGGRIP